MAANAQRAFRKTMKRVDGLLALHPVIHGGPGRPAQHVSDVLRGALVLALAGLDALVLDSIAEAVPKLARMGRLGSTASKWVKDDPDRILACFAVTSPSDGLGDICRDALGHQTFQRAVAIEGILRDVVGVDGLWNGAAKNLAKDGKNWSSGEVADHLDAYVLRRNRIAHGGDFKEGTTATTPIRLAFVREAAIVVRAVGDSVVKLIAARTR